MGINFGRIFQGLTCFYMAPEQLVDSSRYTAAVDEWAAGCAHIEMLLGGPIFFKDSSASQLLCIFELSDLRYVFFSMINPFIGVYLHVNSIVMGTWCAG